MTLDAENPQHQTSSRARRTLAALPLLTAAALAPGCTGGPTIDQGDREIVGGEPTDSYPAVAMLIAEHQDGTASLCSGTVISERVVLTAAHCVDFEQAPVKHVAYFGSDITDEADPAHLATIPIVESYGHPEWNPELLSAGHDVGLVLLAENAPVPPMPIHRKSLGALVGDQVHLVGWGRTDGDSKDYGKKREVLSTVDSQSPLLLTYGSETANTCQGDSGGPNFVTVGGTEVVAGVTSYGNTGCDQFGVGTNVAAFAEGFIDPWVLAKDPEGACASDDQCNDTACAAVDPDCGQEVAGPGAPTEDSAEPTAGCSTGRGASAGVGAAAITLLAIACISHRRARHLTP